MKVKCECKCAGAKVHSRRCKVPQTPSCVTKCTKLFAQFSRSLTSRSISSLLLPSHVHYCHYTLWPVRCDPQTLRKGVTQQSSGATLFSPSDGQRQQLNIALSLYRLLRGLERLRVGFNPSPPRETHLNTCRLCSS